MTGGKANLAASVRQRLLNQARSTGRPFNELLQYYAMERFLYRLSCSEHAQGFVLKGGLMLAYWGVSITRPTKDIDLLGAMSNDVTVLEDLVRNMCAQEVVADGMAFDPATVVGERIAEEAKYEGVRIRFRGSLGTARVAMQIDVGFGDAVIPEPVYVDYPALLDLPPPRIRGYTRESVVAEKFHAMVHRGLLNSRLRDFFDVWSLSRQFPFHGANLTAAIRATFTRRGLEVPALPVALTPSFASDSEKTTQWQGFLRRSRVAGAPGSLAEVVRYLNVFLGPVASSMAQQKPFKLMWHPPGPWSAGRS